jgi:hypothetical protein
MSHPFFRAPRLSAIRFINDNKPDRTQYIDWDANSDIQKLPATDLVGISAFSINNEEKLHRVTFGVLVGTMNDPNLFRISEYVDLYYGLMQPEEEFLIYHPETGMEIGKALFTNGAAVHPINRFETRIAQAVQGSALITLT